MLPETRYAKTGNVHIAYQVFGKGQIDIVLIDGPARAIRCAFAIGLAVRGLGIEIRMGLHTGEVEMRDSDVSGIAIHIASRIASLSGPNQILVSRTVKDLVAGSGIRFAERGVEQLAGLKEPMELYMAME